MQQEEETGGFYIWRDKRRIESDWSKEIADAFQVKIVTWAINIYMPFMIIARNLVAKYYR